MMNPTLQPLAHRVLHCGFTQAPLMIRGHLAVLRHRPPFGASQEDTADKPAAVSPLGPPAECRHAAPITPHRLPRAPAPLSAGWKDPSESVTYSSRCRLGRNSQFLPSAHNTLDSLAPYQRPEHQRQRLRQWESLQKVRGRS